MIPTANGLAFEAGGTLLAASYSSGALPAEARPRARDCTRDRRHGSVGPRRIALDPSGRIYATSRGRGEAVRFAADGSDLESLLGGIIDGPANLEFGVGALRCNDLYVTSGGGALRRIETDATGAAVPWH